MAKTNYEYQEDRIVPTATGIMSPFTNLKENTDGTVGKIDGVNTRSECITRDHLDDPNAVGDTLTRGYIASAVTISTTSFSDVQDIPYVKTIGTTDMLRIEFNPFATVTAYTGGGGTPDDKGATNYYLQIFYTPSGGGSDVPHLSYLWFWNYYGWAWLYWLSFRDFYILYKKPCVLHLDAGSLNSNH